MSYKIKIKTSFEIDTVFYADNYLEAVQLNSVWLEENYADLEKYKTGQWGKFENNSCEICEENQKENPEGKWCTSCKDDYKESNND